MRKKIKTLLFVFIALISLTGCSKSLTDSNKKIVQNPETGQSLTKNILCQPENEKVIGLYNENGVDISKLPKCNDFKVTSGGYEGIWTTIFVKPLAWIIVLMGKLVKNYGLAIIIITLAIRLILYPLTKKTAMQSELMKKAQPEMKKLENNRRMIEPWSRTAVTRYGLTV